MKKKKELAGVDPGGLADLPAVGSLAAVAAAPVPEIQETPMQQAQPSEATPATTDIPAVSPAVARPGGGGGGLAVALLALVVAAVALAMPWLRPLMAEKLGVHAQIPLLAAPADPALAATTARLDGIEARIAGLAAQPAPTPAPAAVDPALIERISRAEARIEAVEAAAAAARQSDGFARHGRVALALMRLSDQAETHQPFDTELAIARDLAGGDAGIAPALEAMAPFAATGVATSAELRDGFGAILAPRLVQSPGWTTRMTGWISAVLPLAGEPPAPEAGPRVAAAIEHLAADDLAGAVNQVAGLPAPASELAARWLTEARARLAIEGARAGLRQALASLLSAR